MKKIRTILTAAAVLIAVSAFATEPVRVLPAVKAAFEKDFANAETVNWQKNSDFYFASFTMDNVKTDAAYNSNGELLGTARIVPLARVPLAISMAISERYAGYRVEETAIELYFEGVTKYLVNVENDNHILKLKCLSNGELGVERKTKK